jgi:hypothetical protein
VVRHASLPIVSSRLPVTACCPARVDPPRPRTGERDASRRADGGPRGRVRDPIFARGQPWPFPPVAVNSAPRSAAWEPFRELDELQRRIADLMQSVWSGVRAGDGQPWVPAADLEQTDDAWIVEAELPGVRRENVNVELADADLVIWGESRSVSERAPCAARPGAGGGSSTGSRCAGVPTPAPSKRAWPTVCSSCASPNPSRDGVGMSRSVREA